MFKKLLVYLFLLVGSLSCSFFKSNKDEDKEVVARVNDTYLYKEDLLAGLPKNYKENDSALLISIYINNWAKQQLLLSKAKINLDDDETEINKLVDKYKQDLLINKYREAVVLQNLDTIVNASAIDSFYNNNKGMFRLSESLIKLKFIRFSVDIIDKEKIIFLFKSDEVDDIAELKSRKLEFKSYHFDNSIWIKYADALKILPILAEYKIEIIGENTYIEKENLLDVYLIKIHQIVSKNSTSPKSYVTPTIKQMMLHARKLELLKKIEQTLLNDANKNGQYEIYK